MKSLELFAGAGGLAIGMEKAGFHSAAVVEIDEDACDTLRFNKERGVQPVKGWNILQEDVRSFNYKGYEDRVDVISGGPPCQPFSLGGKHRGHKDRRDMFPEAVRAVREVRPKAFVFENVRGLLRQSFAKYFEYILLQLTYPCLQTMPSEKWEDHLSRLEKHHTQATGIDLQYQVVFRLLNAADFGVPQKRERVIFVGFRKDLGIEWTFPNSTHSEESLWWDKWVTGDYWERHSVSKRQRSPIPDFVSTKLRGLFPPGLKPWMTVREALSGLPDPRSKTSSDFINHCYQPGARSYIGHTGSPLDEPAKTLKAGDHGVPGGENMMVTPEGEIRYFTIRESARLQNFPDDFGFRGSWSESMRQIGNAVPTELAYCVARGILEKLGKTIKNGG